jgi:hypothetical protein
MKMSYTYKYLASALLALWFISCVTSLPAQSSASPKRILVDVFHGQKFWNDPSAMSGQDTNLIKRVKYMNGELVKNATALKAEVSYLKDKITSAALAKSNVLFIHIPSSQYDADEIKAIQQYVQKGGSLFLVMDANFHSTLEQTKVNDILGPFNIQFGGDSPVTQTGGHSKAGAVTQRDFSIPYHGARTLKGGTPFCFSNQTEEHPFGTFTTVKNGGKIIAMGDGMVSLYMTSWQNVNNYQCSEFMQDVFAWLLR